MLELLSVDDEGVLRELAHESLQVEATLLQEDDVLVAHSLLGRAEGKDDTGPSLLEAIVQEIELVVSTLAFPLTLRVLTADNIDDMTMEVLGVSD